jgi:hypothetical protein
MWFMDKSYTYINIHYLALREVVEKEAFQSKMCRPFKDANSSDKWDEKRRKFGYSSWMEDRLNYTLYNIVSILEKYKKL